MNNFIFEWPLNTNNEFCTGIQAWKKLFSKLKGRNDVTSTANLIKMVSPESQISPASGYISSLLFAVAVLGTEF